MKRFLSLFCLALTIIFLLETFSAQAPLAAARREAPVDLPHKIFLPLITSSICESISGESFSTLVVNPPPTDRPAAQHADLNLALRGYTPTTGTLGLVDYGGAGDSRAPQLYTLFADKRVPRFSGLAQVYDWDWVSNSRAAPIADPPVTLVQMQLTPGETLHVPASGYDIGTRRIRPWAGFFQDAPGDEPNAFEVLVLYATSDRITLKYTRTDNVIAGYTLHVENVCVAPDLVNLYQASNQAGRTRLPALRAGQRFARAKGESVGIVIRDTGSFMDPRSRKDWWQYK